MKKITLILLFITCFIKSQVITLIDANSRESTNFEKITSLPSGAVLDGVVYAQKDGFYYKRQFSGPLNVKSYGAKGDGVTDDANAIQKAFDSGYNIYFPAGTYMLISKCVKINKNIKITGDGSDRSIIFKKAPVVNGFEGGLYTYPDKNDFLTVSIDGIGFVGDAVASGSDQWNHLVSLNNTKNSVVRNCAFKAFRGDGLILSAGSYMNPPQTTRQNFNITVENCLFDGVVPHNRNGISIINCKGVVINNNVFQNIGNDQLNQSVGPIDFESDIRNDEMQTDFAYITNNKFLNNNQTNISSITLFLGSKADGFVGIRNFIISGNYFSGNYTGISVNAGQDVNNDPTETYKNINITNNQFSKNYNDIFISGKGIIIEKNVFEGAQNLPIQSDPWSRVDNVKIKDNYFGFSAYGMKFYSIYDFEINDNRFVNVYYMIGLTSPVNTNKSLQRFILRNNQVSGVAYVILDDVGYTNNIDKNSNYLSENYFDGVTLVARGSQIFRNQ